VILGMKKIGRGGREVVGARFKGVKEAAADGTGGRGGGG
jgi:hypothetical protein